MDQHPSPSPQSEPDRQPTKRRTSTIGMVLVIVGTLFYVAVVFIEQVDWREIDLVIGSNIWQVITIAIGILIVAAGGFLIQLDSRKQKNNGDSEMEILDESEVLTDPDASAPTTENRPDPERTRSPHTPRSPRSVRRPASRKTIKKDSPHTPRPHDRATADSDKSSEENLRERPTTTLLDDGPGEPIDDSDIAAIDRYIDDTRESLSSAKTIIKICCPNCGTLNDDLARFCDQCGHELESK